MTSFLYGVCQSMGASIWRTDESWEGRVSSVRGCSICTYLLITLDVPLFCAMLRTMIQPVWLSGTMQSEP